MIPPTPSAARSNTLLRGLPRCRRLPRTHARDTQRVTRRGHASPANTDRVLDIVAVARNALAPVAGRARDTTSESRVSESARRPERE